MELFIEEVDLASFLSDVEFTARPMIIQNSNKLFVDKDKDLGVIEADATKLRQTVLNLLSNAAKFTQSGRIDLIVEREEIDTKEWVRISVKDSGVGISEEHSKLLFSNFSQAHPSIAAKFGGTGLGLSVSQKLCQLMGGEITIESEVGVGSTFTILLPAHAEAGVGGLVIQEDMSPITAETTSIEDVETIIAEMGNEENKDIITIVVIDDDKAVLELIDRQLTKQGYKIITTDSAQTGMQLTRSVQPDLVLLDIQMPGTDGWEVLRVLKSDKVTCDCPVAILSVVDERRKVLELGAVELISKPFSVEKLDRLIEHLNKTRDDDNQLKKMSA